MSYYYGNLKIPFSMSSPTLRVRLTFMMDSPCPVDEAAPISLSAYAPAPTVMHFKNMLVNLKHLTLNIYCFC